MIGSETFEPAYPAGLGWLLAPYQTKISKKKNINITLQVVSMSLLASLK